MPTDGPITEPGLLDRFHFVSGDFTPVKALDVKEISALAAAAEKALDDKR